MATPISALEHGPRDFIREVSLDAVNFYVDGLSGLYMPEDFKEKHSNVTDVRFWEPRDRLRGKFGRFAVEIVHDDDESLTLDHILLIGTTVGLTGLDQYGNLASLRHYNLRDKVRHVLQERGLVGSSVQAKEADYGSTNIVVGESGAVEEFSVGGSSIDYGRANAEGRILTCSLFERMLEGQIGVVNSEPLPRLNQKIVS